MNTQPTFKHILLASGKQKEEEGEDEENPPSSSPEKDVEPIPNRVSFDQYYHLTRGGIGDVVLQRLGKLDTKRLWDWDEDEHNHGEALEQARDGQGETEEGPNMPADEAQVEDEELIETTEEDEGAESKPKVVYRTFIEPQRQLDLGSDVIVTAGPHLGFRGKLLRKLSTPGYRLVRSESKLCTVHQTELVLHRPPPAKRKPTGKLTLLLQGDTGRRSYLARSSFLKALPKSDLLLAKEAFDQAGFMQRKGAW